MNQEALIISDWLYDINIITKEDITYWIHKTQINPVWQLTNFNYNITNLDLKTYDLDIAMQRSIIIIKNKINLIKNM